jgi:hypothetical protein
MIGPPANRPESQAAPPTKRANPPGIPVRLHDGALVAHASEAVAESLLQAGAAESLRRGPRRYLRLRPGITVPRTERGWDLIEFLRRWHGDKRTAAYVAYKDRLCERLSFQSTGQRPERQPSDKGAK